LTSGRAFFTAIANPHLRIAGKSITSSPTKAASAEVIPSFARICCEHRSLVLNALVKRDRSSNPAPATPQFSEIRLVMIPVFDPRQPGQ